MKPRVIIVSGGSRGLGLSIIEHLLRMGHVVSTFARTRTEAIAGLESQYPGSLFFAAAEATDENQVSEFVRAVVSCRGRIDGLVNNAAIGQDHLLAHMSPALIRRLVAVNLEAPILLTRLVARQMLLQEDGGRIVNISSICGHRGFAGLTVYSACKAGLEAFSRSLAREVGRRGVLVNSVAPGFFESEMSSVLSPEQVDVLRRRTPTGRLTTAQDLLRALDFLLFESSNMTGQTLIVDGGMAT